jgi:hypothetical protein
MTKKLFAGLFATFFVATSAFPQSSIIRGEVSPGVYENIKTDGAQRLVVSSGAAASWAQTAPTVTNSTGQLLAANTSRKSLLVQNNHATGIIYLNFGASATTANMQLGPGQSLFVTSQVPSQAINAIGSVASNTAVVVIEGQ